MCIYVYIYINIYKYTYINICIFIHIYNCFINLILGNHFGLGVNTQESVPTYIGRPAVGENSSQCLWAGKHPWANRSQQSSLLKY